MYINLYDNSYVSRLHKSSVGAHVRSYEREVGTELCAICGNSRTKSNMPALFVVRRLCPAGKNKRKIANGHESRIRGWPVNRRDVRDRGSTFRKPRGNRQNIRNMRLLLARVKTFHNVVNRGSCFLGHRPFVYVRPAALFARRASSRLSLGTRPRRGHVPRSYALLRSSLTSDIRPNLGTSRASVSRFPTWSPAFSRQARADE